MCPGAQVVGHGCRGRRGIRHVFGQHSRLGLCDERHLHGPFGHLRSLPAGLGSGAALRKPSAPYGGRQWGAQGCAAATLVTGAWLEVDVDARYPKLVGVEMEVTSRALKTDGNFDRGLLKI